MKSSTFTIAENGETGRDRMEVTVTELETNQGIQLRVQFPFVDDVQIHLIKGKPTIRYFSEKGTPQRKEVGSQIDEIPF